MRLVTTMLADINTKLAAHDAKLAELVPQSATSSDEESEVEETLSQPRRRPITQASCTQPTTQWSMMSLEVIFTSEGKPAIYICMRNSPPCPFVQGYLTVMNSQKQDIRKHPPPRPNVRWGGLWVVCRQSFSLLLASTYQDG